jgi:predicted extracellular nuclease
MNRNRRLIWPLLAATVAVIFLLFDNEEEELTEVNSWLMFYNVENLFDTLDAPGKWDEEFSPDSAKQWNTERYYDKLSKLSRVVRSATPDLGILALCEVENYEVVWDLAKAIDSTASLKVVHEESPDFRGIDNALVYDPDEFRYFWHQAVPVTFADTGYTTRDILAVGLEMKNGDSLFVFVNHWPSRRGGMKKSAPRRARAAEVLRNLMDSIGEALPASHLIAVGDFNDYPPDSSVSSVLGAGKGMKYQNLSAPIHAAGLGSYCYRGEWGVLDQVIIDSKSQVNNLFDTSYIFKENFMLYYSERDKDSLPSRSYGGPKYYGGCSDHLPSVTRISYSY